MTDSIFLSLVLAAYEEIYDFSRIRAYFETARKKEEELWYLDNNTKIKSGLEPIVAKPYYPI
jgi:hypothetical protein